MLPDLREIRRKGLNHAISLLPPRLRADINSLQQNTFDRDTRNAEPLAIAALGLAACTAYEASKGRLIPSIALALAANSTTRQAVLAAGNRALGLPLVEHETLGSLAKATGRAIAAEAARQAPIIAERAVRKLTSGFTNGVRALRQG